MPHGDDPSLKFHLRSCSLVLLLAELLSGRCTNCGRISVVVVPLGANACTTGDAGPVTKMASTASTQTTARLAGWNRENRMVKQQRVPNLMGEFI
jgi:hypothetical protein